MKKLSTIILIGLISLLMFAGCSPTIKTVAPRTTDAPRTIDEPRITDAPRTTDNSMEEEAKPSASAPVSVLKRFQDANNNRDLEALMDCYDPEFMEFSQALGEGIGGALSEMFLGFSVNADSSKLIPFFSKVFQKYVQSDDIYAKLELIEISTDYTDDDNATIQYIERVITQNGAIASENESMIPVTKVNGVWYISMSDVLAEALTEFLR